MMLRIPKFTKMQSFSKDWHEHQANNFKSVAQKIQGCSLLTIFIYLRGGEAIVAVFINLSPEPIAKLFHHLFYIKQLTVLITHLTQAFNPMDMPSLTLTLSRREREYLPLAIYSG